MLEGNLFLSLADHLRVDHILHEFFCLDFPWIVRPFFTFNNPGIFRMSGSFSLQKSDVHPLSLPDLSRK
jgi:hypothetical protein